MSGVTDERFVEVLNEALVEMLTRHEVEARVARGGVLVGPRRLRAQMYLESAPVAGGRLVGITAESPDGTPVEDHWVAGGADAHATFRDGMQAFSSGDFHVLLAGLWGLLETDKVDHQVVGDWDLYMGAWVGRASRGASMAAPDAFQGWWKGVVPRLLDGPETRSIRIFASAMNRQMTYEVVVDGQARADLQAELAGCGWVPPAEGYASQRMFMLLRKRHGGPSHDRVGACG